MADPLGILSVIGVASKIAQFTVQLGLAWKDAPADAKGFYTELQALKTVLSETNTNIILNDDFKDAFRGKRSALLTQLGPGKPKRTNTLDMVKTCKQELRDLRNELKKRARGGLLSWERLKGAFTASQTREAVENLHRQCQILNSLVAVDALSLTVQIHKEQRGWLADKESKTVLKWLTAADYGPQQSDYIARRQEGTGKWLLGSKEYKRWVDTSSEALFCPGIPGAGKTIITSIVVDDLQKRFRDDRTSHVGIAFIYCNFRRKEDQKTEDLLASLLKQLCQGQTSLPDCVKELYTEHKAATTRPQIDEIVSALHTVVSLYSRVFLLVDALDECQMSGGKRATFLKNLLALQTKSGANVFATSRFVHEVTERFSKTPWREIQAHDDDVRRYVDGNISKLPSFVATVPGLQEETKTAIVESVQGMFLLAQLHLESLVGKRSPKVFRAALKSLPSGSSAYDCAYEATLERIKVRDQEALANQVLAWITYATRPLTTLELQTALAVELNETALDPDNVSQVDDIVSACAGLVTVDEESDIIRLVHYTTQEYLGRTRQQWFPNAESDLAKVCLTYLSFGVFESGLCKTEAEFRERADAHPLFKYAACNWGHHTRNASSQGLDTQLAMGFLERTSNVKASVEALLTDTYPQAKHKPEQLKMPVMHLAALFGLDEAVKVLLLSGGNLELRDANGRTALSWAAERNQVKVLKFLLEHGADLHSKDRQDRTPLWWAASEGNDEIVKELLSRKTNLGPTAKASDGNGQGQLDPSINLPLLSEESNTKDADRATGDTPLMLASGRGDQAVVRLLLENGADPNEKNLQQDTAILHAADQGHQGIVKLLLERGAFPHVPNHAGRTPLLGASTRGHEAIVQILLADDRVDPNCRNFTKQRTPLGMAARNCHEAVAAVLLADQRVDVNARDLWQRTPLAYAARSFVKKRKSATAIATLLLAHGATADVTDEWGLTPLSYAAAKGNKTIVKLLLAAPDVRLNVNRKDCFGGTPLFWSVVAASEAIPRILSDHGAIAEAEKWDLAPLEKLAKDDRCFEEVTHHLFSDNTINLLLWDTSKRDSQLVQEYLQKHPRWGKTGFMEGKWNAKKGKQSLRVKRPSDAAK